MSAPMMRLEKVTVHLGRREILRDFSLDIAEGRTVALLGPNGCGKTTALRALAGALPLSAGRRQAPPVIGYLPQAGEAAPPYRALDVVVMGRARALGLFGQPGPKDEAEAIKAMTTVGVEGLAEQACDRLSGGQRQLVLLARALATGSPALILDEPTAGLDLANGQRFLAFISRLRLARHHAIVFSTHDPNHALRVADEAVLMMPGGETLAGPVEEVVTASNLERLYGIDIMALALPSTDPAAPTTVFIPDFPPPSSR